LYNTGGREINSPSFIFFVKIPHRSLTPMGNSFLVFN